MRYCDGEPEVFGVVHGFIFTIYLLTKVIAHHPKMRLSDVPEYLTNQRAVLLSTSDVQGGGHSEKMALSTLRFAARPLLIAHQSIIVARCTAPMATTAQEEMKKFWNKNLTLQRPNSPWMVYKPHLPMLTSLCHRMTGIAMGVAFYAFSIGVFLAPGDFPSYVEFIKNLEISPALLFPAKTIVAFPLVYHYINGIRHLTWDAGHGYELKTQYKTGWTIVATTISLSALLASLAYW